MLCGMHSPPIRQCNSARDRWQRGGFNSGTRDAAAWQACRLLHKAAAAAGARAPASLAAAQLSLGRLLALAAARRRRRLLGLLAGHSAVVAGAEALVHAHDLHAVWLG